MPRGRVPIYAPIVTIRRIGIGRVPIVRTVPIVGVTIIPVSVIGIVVSPIRPRVPAKTKAEAETVIVVSAVISPMISTVPPAIATRTMSVVAVGIATTTPIVAYRGVPSVKSATPRVTASSMTTAVTLGGKTG
jgi:hypothetical protein